MTNYTVKRSYVDGSYVARVPDNPLVAAQGSTPTAAMLELIAMQAYPSQDGLDERSQAQVYQALDDTRDIIKTVRALLRSLVAEEKYLKQRAGVLLRGGR